MTLFWMNQLRHLVVPAFAGPRTQRDHIQFANMANQASPHSKHMVLEALPHTWSKQDFENHPSNWIEMRRCPWTMTSRPVFLSGQISYHPEPHLAMIVLLLQVVVAHPECRKMDTWHRRASWIAKRGTGRLHQWSFGGTYALLWKQLIGSGCIWCFWVETMESCKIFRSFFHLAVLCMRPHKYQLVCDD